jgi:hypothetical protein
MLRTFTVLATDTVARMPADETTGCKTDPGKRTNLYRLGFNPTRPHIYQAPLTVWAVVCDLGRLKLFGKTNGATSWPMAVQLIVSEQRWFCRTVPCSGFRGFGRERRVPNLMRNTIGQSRVLKRSGSVPLQYLQ